MTIFSLYVILVIWIIYFIMWYVQNIFYMHILIIFLKIHINLISDLASVIFKICNPVVALNFNAFIMSGA